MISLILNFLDQIKPDKIDILSNFQNTCIDIVICKKISLKNYLFMTILLTQYRNFIAFKLFKQIFLARGLWKISIQLEFWDNFESDFLEKRTITGLSHHYHCFLSSLLKRLGKNNDQYQN